MGQKETWGTQSLRCKELEIPGSSCQPSERGKEQNAPIIPAGPKCRGREGTGVLSEPHELWGHHFTLARVGGREGRGLSQMAWRSGSLLLQDHIQVPSISFQVFQRWTQPSQSLTVSFPVLQLTSP